jgi:hypothetical protein
VNHQFDNGRKRQRKEKSTSHRKARAGEIFQRNRNLSTTNSHDTCDTKVKKQSADGLGTIDEPDTVSHALHYRKYFFISMNTALIGEYEGEW